MLCGICEMRLGQGVPLTKTSSSNFNYTRKIKMVGTIIRPTYSPILLHVAFNPSWESLHKKEIFIEFIHLFILALSHLTYWYMSSFELFSTRSQTLHLDMCNQNCSRWTGLPFNFEFLPWISMHPLATSWHTCFHQVWA